MKVCIQESNSQKVQPESNSYSRILFHVLGNGASSLWKNGFIPFQSSPQKDAHRWFQRILASAPAASAKTGVVWAMKKKQRLVVWYRGWQTTFEKYVQVKLENISPRFGVKIKNVWNHHLEKLFVDRKDFQKWRLISSKKCCLSCMSKPSYF